MYLRSKKWLALLPYSFVSNSIYRFRSQHKQENQNQRHPALASHDPGTVCRNPVLEIS